MIQMSKKNHETTTEKNLELIPAAGYLRVSTDNQAADDKFGLIEQRELIEKYASNNGFKIVEWYSDPGVSGALLDRPGLNELLKASKGKQFQAVIIAKMDRIARDLYIQLWVEKELKIYDVSLISASEPLNGNDPMTQAFKQMLGVFAQLEKEIIAGRLAGGRKQKANTGGYAGGRAAIGYTAKRGQKYLMVNDEKAAAVRRALELSRKRSLSLQDIADILNREGYTTAENKTFTKMQVKRIIDRKEFYQGIYEYAGIKTEGKHQSIA
jgi:DNA invertase Pin-like site-specific DNA recombinase